MYTLIILFAVIALTGLISVFAIRTNKLHKLVEQKCETDEAVIAVDAKWRRNYQIWFVAMVILSLIVLAIPISQKAIATYNCTEIAQFDNGQLYKENNAENFFFIKTNDWNPIKIIAKTDVDTEYAKEIIQQLEELERLKEGLKTFHQVEE